MVVTIAPAGCADKKQSKVNVVASRSGWIYPGGSKSNAVLRLENVRLKNELRRARMMQSPEALLARLDALVADVLHKLSEVGYAVQENTRLGIELSEAWQSQRSESIQKRLDALGADVLHKISELEYAVRYPPKENKSAERAIEAQRVTIEVLEKLCRLYEDVLGKQRSTIEILKKMCRLYDNEPYLKG